MDIINLIKDLIIHMIYFFIFYIWNNTWFYYIILVIWDCLIFIVKNMGELLRDIKNRVVWIK